MTYLLFPGRHHLLTNFQMEQMKTITREDPSTILDIDGNPLEVDNIDTVVWAITSANHSNTRRNPLPDYRRAEAIGDFARDLDATSLLFPVEDIHATPDFARYVLNTIEVRSNGLRLTPENTVVGCSTPAVIEMYEKLGFKILPFELGDRDTVDLKALTPWQLTQTIVEADDWRTDETFLREVHPASIILLQKYGLGDLIIDLHSDPLLGDDGDITETRDYNTYVRSFDAGAERKYKLIKDLVVPGRIVDIGCCTGALIQQLTKDASFRESDFYGIEVARALYRECENRREERYFENDNVFFFQRNVARNPIFPANSIDTFTTFSLTHEIESYQGRETLEGFMDLLYQQTSFGGRWINVDVAGPDDKDQIVYMKLNQSNGRNDDYQADLENNELKTYLEGLSTFARFLRFARDFRHEEGESIDYRIERVDGETYVILRMEDACEFMSKKDYTDNWKSEMHERFCFFNFDEWKTAASNAGFEVNQDSRAFTNPWLVENRFKGEVELYVEEKEGLRQIEYPVTNVLLVCDKQL